MNHFGIPRTTPSNSFMLRITEYTCAWEFQNTYTAMKHGHSDAMLHIILLALSLTMVFTPAVTSDYILTDLCWVLASCHLYQYILVPWNNTNYSVISCIQHWNVYHLVYLVSPTMSSHPETPKSVTWHIGQQHQANKNLYPTLCRYLWSNTISSNIAYSAKKT